MILRIKFWTILRRCFFGTFSFSLATDSTDFSSFLFLITFFGANNFSLSKNYNLILLLGPIFVRFQTASYYVVVKAWPSILYVCQTVNNKIVKFFRHRRLIYAALLIFILVWVLYNIVASLQFLRSLKLPINARLIE